MTTSENAPAAVEDDFVDVCRWVVDAHDGGDGQQLVAALCATYRLLAERGWVPSDKALLLLHLQATHVAAELAGLCDPQERGPDA